MKQTDKIRKHWESKGWFVVNLIKTNKNGIPDYMMLKNGSTIFVESKKNGIVSVKYKSIVSNKLNNMDLKYT